MSEDLFEVKEDLSEDLFEVKEDLSQERLETLTSLVKEYKDTELEIEKLSLMLKDLNTRLESVSRVSIPTIFNEIGLSQIRLQSGQVVTVEDKVKASIADKNSTVAYRNMVNAEGGDESKVDALFKSKIIIEEYTDSVVEILLSKNIPYDTKRDIHWQTLSKYCRERLDRGEIIPEGISVFQYQETKIK